MQLLLAADADGHGHERLARLEQAKAMPWGAVWDMLCLRADTPPAETWLANVTHYEITVLSQRG